jgi:hypothetical protein
VGGVLVKAAEHPYRPFPTEVIDNSPKFPRVICSDEDTRIVAIDEDIFAVEELSVTRDAMNKEVNRWVSLCTIRSDKWYEKNTEDKFYARLMIEGLLPGKRVVDESIAAWLVEQIAHLTGR